MSKINPDPLDIAFWAIKLLRFDNFKPHDEEEFFVAFLKAYRASTQFVRDFEANEKEKTALRHSTQK
jgi:hypothetical protein